MDKARSPEWLAKFQEEFSQVLLSPLNASSGRLEARTADYPEALVQEVVRTSNRSQVAPLAVYNKQYWFRLCGVMQTEFPLVARLLGYWLFNHLAMEFLRQRPLSSDLRVIGHGFADFLAHWRRTLGQPWETPACLPPLWWKRPALMQRGPQSF